MTEDENHLLRVTFGDGCSPFQESTLPGVPLVDLPTLELSDGTMVHAVFVRGSMNGYPTRLFFDRQLQPRAGNLNLTTHPFRGTVIDVGCFAHQGGPIPRRRGG